VTSADCPFHRNRSLTRSRPNGAATVRERFDVFSTRRV
jgi:hypothetical protein